MLIQELRQAREDAGWSQRTLASRIGTDTQTIHRLENAVGSARTLAAAMAALKFRLTGLAGGATLAQQLSAKRLKRGWSVDKAAVRAGLSPATVVSLEQGGGTVASLVKLLMALAPKARRRAPERTYWGQGDKEARDIRFTPLEFMNAIYQSFGAVCIDPCGHLLSPVVARRRILLSEGGDGLKDEWGGRLAFVNPPYSELLPWLARAYEQWRAGHVETVVCLVPVRTDSKLFHEMLSVDGHIYLLRSRLKFLDPQGGSSSTPFSLMVLTFGATLEQRSKFAELVPGLWMTREQVAGLQRR